MKESLILLKTDILAFSTLSSSEVSIGRNTFETPSLIEFKEWRDAQIET